MLTTTKAQYRKAIRDAAKPIKVVDPNKRLTVAQLKRMYEEPGKLAVQMDALREQLQNKGHARLLARMRLLKQEYLEAQTKLALAYQDPQYARYLFKIRLQDTSR